MRKIKTIKSSSADAISYYTQDEQHKLDSSYYSDSGQGEYLSTEWYGNGAKELGLEGAVSAEDLERTMKGFTKEGDRLRPEPKDGVERYAHDFTISAPKSVSIALYLGNDIRIFKAHLKAVRKTLDLVESRYAKARLMVDGERQIEETNNIAVAIINHATSRANDPQLHSHCLIQNATLRSDGQWRSLFPEGLNQADWLGSFYQAELERELNGLGYQTYRTRDAFELEGLSQAALDNFSQRTNEIAQYLTTHKLDDTPANRQKAALESRKDKTKAKSLEQLQKHWKAEAKICGIHVPQPSHHPVTQPQASASELIDSAIAHHAERLVSFRREDLYRYAYENGKTPYLEGLDRAIEAHPKLIEYKRGNFTTQSALDREIEAIELMESGMGIYEPYGIQPLAESLNAGQRSAIEGVLQSSSQVMVWHGKSGVGKTFALGELKAATNLKIRGLSPTRKAAGELAESLEIETDTVQGHLLKEAGNNELWVVDEAGLLSAEDGLKLLHKAEEHQARVLLVGDIRQNQSIGAGSFMKSLIDHGAQTWNISKILRQENDIQQRAVELISNGQGKDALTLLDDHGYIEEAPNQEARATAIAKEYVAHPDSLIVAGTNSDRAAIAKAIRRELDLKDKHSVQRLIPLGLTKEQLRQSHNFSIGDYLRLERNYKTASIERGQLYKVVGKEARVLLLQSTNGRRYRLDPKLYKEKSLYRTESIPLDVGDRIRWTRNEKALGLNNGDVGTIAAINKKSLSIHTSKGVRTLPLNQPLSLDYGYSSTTYQGQGKTAKRVLVSATNDPTSSVEPFYVATSRQRQELKVFAEDKEQLYRWVQNSNQQKNPLELLQPDSRTVKPKQKKRIKTEKSKRVKPDAPLQIPVYWRPKYDDAERPGYINPHHWEEFKKSAIHPDLIKLNLRSIEQEQVLIRLLEDKFATLGSGQTTNKKIADILQGRIKVKYSDLNTKRVHSYKLAIPRYSYENLAEHGGWYGTAGIDPLNNWERSRWGCFKGDVPRISKQTEEPIKYEHPLGTEREFFLANVPDWLAKDILSKHKIEFQPGDNFWKIVHEQNLPIMIIEGYKKSLSALSQGEIAIGIPGVNALYQANEKVNGQKFKLDERKLTKNASFWATPGRQIKWAFDKDTKLSAILNVQRDLVRAIELMPECEHKVLNWESAKGKGVDDLNAHNPRLFAKASLRAGSADRVIKAHYRRQYNLLKKKGLSDKEIWVHASRQNDIKDGDRVIAQSDYIRKNPHKAEFYLEAQRMAGLKLMRRQHSPKKEKAPRKQLEA